MNEPETKRKGLFGRFFGGKPQPAPAGTIGEAAQGAPGEIERAGGLTAPEAPPGAPLPASGEAGEAVEQPSQAPAQPISATAAAESQPQPKLTWFQRLKAGLGKTSGRLSEGITGLFTKRKLDAGTLEELEDLLIQSDLGIAMAARIADAIGKGRFEKGISPDEVRAILAGEVEKVLAPIAKPLAVDDGHKPHVIMMVGVNGSGKTTTIGKLAAKFKAEGKSVMLAAGDTFRAAAIDQLKVWGERTGTPVVSSAVGADSSGLAFDALKKAQAAGSDVLLLDTAGRLQNKQALMEELEKVTRVLKKIDPSAPHDVVLVLDATTGQNALQQVDVFGKRAGVTGLVMTKLDGTARGGILVAIGEKFKLPVHAIGIGEGVDDLQPFAAADFARAIAG
ncbi:MAG TPA: signal recognition particle-docking protein FtsY [Hyphomicrobium sp.]|nr:signal recognition particle-docking protein FtsY [Hyphomicrobium sp.]